MNHLTRRTLLGVALATQLVPAGSAYVATPFGACIHSTFRTSVYGDDDAVYATLLNSGARYVRDLLGTGTYHQVPLFRRFRDAGIAVHCTVGVHGETTVAGRAECRERLLAIADCVDSVAGWNEPDRSGKLSSWLPSTVDQQRWLYEMVKGDSALTHITVLPGALRDRNPNLAADLSALYSAIAGYYDVPNLHVYPGPTKDPRAYLAARLAMVPGGRAWITEAGGSTANMTEARQAFVCSELVKAQAERGDRCYVYELLDDAGTDAQSLFGIYRTDSTRKPAAAALAVL